MPYNQSGQTALGQFQPLYDQTQAGLTTAYNNAQNAIPTSFTQAQLLNQPSYQFQLQQGQKALQNSLAGRGLSGLSGTQAKSIVNFGTGLASANYNTMFNQAQQQYADLQSQFTNQATMGNSLFSQLSSRAQLGENAAAQTGVQGTLSAGSQGNNIAGAGQSSAAGQVQSANALGSGLATAGNAINGYIQSPAGKAALGGIDSSSTQYIQPSTDYAVGSTGGQANAGTF